MRGFHCHRQGQENHCSNGILPTSAHESTAGGLDEVQESSVAVSSEV